MADSNKKSRVLSKFLCQEMLYDYVTDNLDEGRKKSVADFIKENPDMKSEEEALRKSLEYCESLSKTNVSEPLVQELIEAKSRMNTFVNKVHWSSWSDQVKWGAEAFLVSMFVVTSADSATFVLGMFTSKGVLNPTRFVRILWGVLQLLMAGVLLLSGGLVGLRTVSIVTAFPFMLLMVLMAYSLYKDISLEWRRREEREGLLQQRLESLLLRESEREAALRAEEEAHPSAPESINDAMVNDAENDTFKAGRF